MEENFNTYIDSSLKEIKKAIVSYNNFLSKDRFENFIVFSHIGFNRLFVAYHIKMEIRYDTPRAKVKGFFDLSQELYNSKMITKDDILILNKLNELRNGIEHSVIDESILIKIKESYLMVSFLLIIYKKILNFLDKSQILSENIVSFSDPFVDDENQQIEKLDEYSKNLKDFINKIEGFDNHSTVSADETISEDFRPIKSPKEDIVDSLSAVDKTWKKPGELCKMISNDLTIKFDTNDLAMMRSYLQLFRSKDSDVWSRCPGSNPQVYDSVKILKTDYCQKYDLTRSVVYNVSLVPLIVEIIKPIGENFKPWLKEKKKGKELYKPTK